jgi:hypothetical protein
MQDPSCLLKYPLINWRKSNEHKCTVIVYIFLKCIYLFIAPTCFGYSLAIIRVLVIWYSGRTKCIFSEVQLFTLRVLESQFTTC